nr:hypothetical protein [Tanacetum cinerariifolium]
MFMGADRVKTARIQTLKAEFESLNMKETEGMDEFAVKVSNIVSTMRALGDTVEESYIVKKLLRAIPSKFLQIASTLEQFGDLDMMTVEESGQKETRKKERATPNQSQITMDLEAHEAEADEEVVIMVVMVVVEVDHTIKEKEVKVRLAVKIRAGYNAIIAKSMDIMQLSARIQGEGMDEFAVKVSNIVSTMRALGDTVEESYIVKKLLRAIPSKFLQITSTLEQFGDLDMMTVEEVIERLKAHEERMKG